MSTQEDVILADQFREVCGVTNIIGIEFNGPLVVKAEIRESIVESIITGEMFQRSHLYEWHFNPEYGLWILYFHELL